MAGWFSFERINKTIGMIHASKSYQEYAKKKENEIS